MELAGFTSIPIQNIYMFVLFYVLALMPSYYIFNSLKIEKQYLHSTKVARIPSYVPHKDIYDLNHVGRERDGDGNNKLVESIDCRRKLDCRLLSIV